MTKRVLSDGKEQSKLFIEKAREIEADEERFGKDEAGAAQKGEDK